MTISLQFYNTLTRRQEPFVPLDPAHVRMYVCGPTVYDFAHIGNARPVVVFDVLYRLLKRQFPKVTYVRNITDVDDKIIAASRESGEPIDTITSRTSRAYHEDMSALGALPPDIEPRATQHIGEMIRMIEILIARGHAYPAEGHVLFGVQSMASYGKLSGHSRDELIAGARVEVAPYKKDPADFVLWKPSTAEQPGWDSPWGHGRPGWHIECSAMSEKHLGESFDIHGGGLDLIFPHHENEIAQSECAHGRPFVRLWMHNGFLTVNGEKMSKSLGNFFTVRDLLGKWPAEAIRLLLLKTHYRAPLDFTEEGLRQARTELDRFYNALRQFDSSSKLYDLAETLTPPADVMDALGDDLNTALALARLHEHANAAFQSAAASHEPGPQVSALFAGGRMLGLFNQRPEAWFKGSVGGASVLSEAEIESQITARLAARKARNFKEADRIRDALKAQGVALEDGAGGTTWRRV